MCILQHADWFFCVFLEPKKCSDKIFLFNLTFTIFCSTTKIACLFWLLRIRWSGSCSWRVEYSVGISHFPSADIKAVRQRPKMHFFPPLELTNHTFIENASYDTLDQQWTWMTLTATCVTWFDMHDMIWHAWHDLTCMTWFDMHDMIWQQSTWMTWFDIKYMICHYFHDLPLNTWFAIKYMICH
jgi:hypothetical protein